MESTQPRKRPATTASETVESVAFEDAFYAAESARQVEMSQLVMCEDPPDLTDIWSKLSNGQSCEYPFLIAGLDTQWVDHDYSINQSISQNDKECSINNQPVDQSVNQVDRVEGIAVCIVWNLATKQVVHTAVKHVMTSHISSISDHLNNHSINDQPIRLSDHQQYRPGFLSLREASHYIELIKGLPSHFKPNVCLIDGGGQFHPRRFGLACSVGVATGLPTVGVAKTVLRGILAGNPDEKKVREMMQSNNQTINQSHGQVEPVRQLMLLDTNGIPLACAVAPTNQSNNQPNNHSNNQSNDQSITHYSGKPVYVSVGHQISLSNAANVVAACQHFVNPEPLRLADIEARRLVRGLTTAVKV